MQTSNQKNFDINTILSIIPYPPKITSRDLIMRAGARLEKNGKISRIPNAFIAFRMDVCRELRAIGDYNMGQPQLSLICKASWDNQPEYVRKAYQHIAASARILYKRMIQKRMQQGQNDKKVTLYEQTPFLDDEMKESLDSKDQFENLSFVNMTSSERFVQDTSNTASGHAIPNWIHQNESPNSTIEESSNSTNFGQPEINSNITLSADLQETFSTELFNNELSCLERGQTSYFDSSFGNINFVSMNSENIMQSPSLESFDNRNYEFPFDNTFSSTSNNLIEPQQPGQREHLNNIFIIENSHVHDKFDEENEITKLRSKHHGLEFNTFGKSTKKYEKSGIPSDWAYELITQAGKLGLHNTISKHVGRVLGC
ncbi:3939_t:CDS:2 [Ambispora leptoticha]|uniref:3939_t:CDS:1 n=1 Tax=Ambispora leptoticha TaxID=144679 RepID=A0A9N9DEP5_9GLOM|nr:3939_t:CDS:2 [Ambispora leptoticha]